MENRGRDFRALCARLDHGCPERHTGFIFRWRQVFSEATGACPGPKNDCERRQHYRYRRRIDAPRRRTSQCCGRKTPRHSDNRRARRRSNDFDRYLEGGNCGRGFGCGDDAMWPLLAKRGAAFIIMHMQGTPPTMQRAPFYHDVVVEVADFFRQQYACALKFGLDPMTLAFDPGIGFGKTLEHNLSLLKNLPRLRVNNRPLVVGVSRKSFLGKISGHNGSIHNRLLPTVAFTSLLRMNGADVLRVHDVEENVEALRVADALRSAP